MKFQIRGANRTNGEDVETTIDAADRAAAEEAASRSDILWTDIVEVVVPSHQTEALPPQESDSEIPLAVDTLIDDEPVAPAPSQASEIAPVEAPAVKEAVVELKPPMPRASAPQPDAQSTARLELARSYYQQAKLKLAQCQTNLQQHRFTLVNVAYQGIGLIDAAIELNPQSPEYWNVKALLLAEGVGSVSQARKCFDRALALEPGSTVIKQNIDGVRQLLSGCAGMIAVAMLGGTATALSIHLIS